MSERSSVSESEKIILPKEEDFILVVGGDFEGNRRYPLLEGFKELWGLWRDWFPKVGFYGSQWSDIGRDQVDKRGNPENTNEFFMGFTLGPTLPLPYRLIVSEDSQVSIYFSDKPLPIEAKV